MTGRIIIATILGAIVLFAWTSYSWMVCPYHKAAQLKFTNEAMVAKVIQENAPKSGIYVLPNVFSVDSKLKPEQQKEAQDKAMAEMKTGPVVFSSVHKEGITSMTPSMVIEFLTGLVSAFLFSLMLLFVKAHHFFCRLGFVILFAVTVAILGDVPNWNWWHFSNEFTYLGMIDKAISWTLAGFIMILIIRCKTTECK